MSRLLFTALIGCVLLSRGALAGPAEDLAAMMGQAIDYFHAGNDLAARPLLNQVIAAQIVDPRAYYYRGLLELRWGNRAQAANDFRAGALLEANHPDPHGLTSIQMYRIQGSARQMLEQYRSEARFAAYQLRERARWARFRGMEEQAALAGETPASGHSLSTPGQAPALTPTAGATPAKPAAVPDDPFAKPTTPAPTTPTPPTTLPADPFGT